MIFFLLKRSEKGVVHPDAALFFYTSHIPQEVNHADRPGKTRTSPVSAEHDLSLPSLTADLMGLIRHIFPNPAEAPALLVRPSPVQHFL